MRKLVFLLLIPLVIVSTPGHAQFPLPDCCSQAIALTKQVNTLSIQLSDTIRRLNDARAILTETRATTTRLLSAKDTRIYQLEKQGTERLTVLNSRAVNAEDLNQQLSTQLQTVTAERDDLRGRTWAGKLLRKARDGLAIVGAAALVGVAAAVAF